MIMAYQDTQQPEQQEESPEQLQHRIDVALYMAPTTDNWHVSQEQFRRLARTGEFAPEQPQEPAR